MRKAILVTIDGWGTNLVGAYGNALCETPNLDHFSARSIVFDRAYTSSPLLNVALQSISNGQHPLEHRLVGNSELAELLQGIGMQSMFMTDDPEVAELPWAQSFNESFCYDPTQSDAGPATREGATDWTETRLAAFMEAALGELARYSDESSGFPDWTWLHLSGLTKTWDAPYADRLQLCDEEDDPEPPHGIIPATFEVDRATDPDLIFGAACGAAAQGKIVDQIWLWLDTFLSEVLERKDCLIILAGIRGYPLGEHRSVGFCSRDLFSELIHTPLIVQPGEMLIGARDDTLVQPMSIWATVFDWLAVGEVERTVAIAEASRRRLSANLIAKHQSNSDSHRSLPPICLVDGPESFSLQVPRWSAVWQPQKDPSTAHPLEAIRLFLSPDDRWQQNDASSRAREISEAMQSLRDDSLRWLADGCPEVNAPVLPECLTRRI